jgi:hypothetical protein
MPRLVLFAACERVLLDPDGLVSLITIIEKIEVKVPVTLQIPPRSSISQRWQSIAMWMMEPSEEGQYEQREDLVIMEGQNEVIAAHTEPMPMVKTSPESDGVKVISTQTTVPVIHGLIFLRLFYRRIGEQQWIGAAEYPVNVVIVRK